MSEEAQTNRPLVLTEQERDDLCDAVVDYTKNHTASAPDRMPHIYRAVGRIVADRVEAVQRQTREVGADHCPACRVARELTEHRDGAAEEWSVRRATLNFARVIAMRACPDYQPARAEETP